jgi:hypothetical protein
VSASAAGSSADVAISVSLDAVLGVLQQRGPAFRTDDTAMIVSMLRPYAHNPCLLVAVDHATRADVAALHVK